MPPLPNDTTVCPTADAFSTDHTVAPDGRFFWDRSVERGRVYHYRVTQLELNASGVVVETPFWSGDQVAGQELLYENDVLPPPQGLRAYAPLSGPDMHGIHLRWCPMPPLHATESMPPIAEYRIYKQGWAYRYALFARIDPACVATDGSGNPVNRCVITDSDACISRQGSEQPGCPLITPTGSCSGSDCVVFDNTATCWPRSKDSLGDQAVYNFSYVVTAMGADASSESVHSTEDQGWLNYCAAGNETSCSLGPCTARRDPDGNAAYFVCGDEQVRLEPGGTGDGERVSAARTRRPHAQEVLAPCRVIGQGGDIPARFLFYHLDHLGSPRSIMDAAGQRVALRHFLPFGDERPVPADPSLTTKAFTGHERDAETGLDYMLARYYSSSLGRFMAVDPKASSARLPMPQSWNRYTYTLNNPLLFVDKAGEDIMLASDVTPAQGAYLRDSLAQTLANPAGAALIGRLEATGVLVVLTVRDLGPDQNLTGTTGSRLSQNVIGIVIDQDAQAETEAVGGNSAAQNLGEELKHAEQILDKGDEAPLDEDEAERFKDRIGPNTPTEETKEEADKVIDTAPADPKKD